MKTGLAAGNQSFAVKSDGSVWGWGWGEGGPRSWPLKANTPLPVRLELALPRSRCPARGSR